MIGTQLAERYQLTAEIGRGGMGVVYRAHDPVLERQVAVKLITGGDPSELHEARFRREAKLVAQLDHPAIVPIFDFGRQGDALFFVMPLLRGETLATRLREGSLTLGEALEIVARVAEALDYSAAEGIVHRDVKPENVMVWRPEGGELRVWVMDFGLALGAASRRITQADQLPGSLYYLSPEYVLSLDLDGRSDLYSLGTVLYECLTGQPPFSGSQGSVLYSIVHQPPPALGVDEELQRIVLGCLAKEPAERPQRGRELAAALRRYAGTLGAGADVEIPIVRPGAAPSGDHRLPPRSATPFVGRGKELAGLEERLAAALAGECQLVLVGGEAGSGKTRLLQELGGRLRQRGVRVLRGRFPGQEATFPHHGFCELVQDYFRPPTDPATGRSSSGSGSPAAGVPAAGAGTADCPDFGDLASGLQALFPTLGEIPAIRDAALRAAPEDGFGESPEDRTRVYELLARTLTRLAAGDPMVLMLEHLHAAAASIEALEYVVRRLGPTPTLVVGTYRTTETPRQHPLARLIRRSKGDPRFLALTLGPLGSDDHRQLVAAWLAGRRFGDPRAVDEMAARLYATTDGHPFFTCELLRSLDESGEIPRGDSDSWILPPTAIGAEKLPETIQQAVEARLERLSGGLRRALAVASVLGRSFDFRDLAELLGGAGPPEGEEAEEAVEELLAEGLLEEERRDRLHFTNALVRDVLHGALTRRKRRRLHRRAGELLERRYAGRLEQVYPRLVHHFSSGDVAVETVTYALMLARISAAAIAPADTLRAARTALEFLEDYELDDTGEVEAELRLLLAAASRLAGSIESALREAGLAATAFERAAEPGAAAGAALLAAEVAWQMRKVEDNRRWLRRGIDLARAAGDRRKLRRLLTLAATVANLRGEHRRARAFLDEAETLAARPDPRAAGRRSAGSGEEATGGTLRTALLNPLTTCDPVASVSLEDAEVLGCVYEPLLDSDADGNPVPRLAAEWQLCDDGTCLTATLRDDLRFSDGTHLGAREVKRSFEWSAQRAVGVPAAAYRAITGIEAFLHRKAEGIRGIEVEGDHRLRFRLRERLPIFPALLTDLRTAVVGDGEILLGTGPFRFVPRLAAYGGGKHGGERAGRRPPPVVLERNPHSWRSPALVDRLEFHLARDAASLAADLRSGELDLGRELPPEDLEEILRDPDFRGGLVEAPKRNVYFVLMNRKGPATRDAAVRRALAGVIRTQDIVWRTLGRFAQPATCLIPPGILGHDAGRKRRILDREQALEVLAEAGLAPPVRLCAAVHPLFLDRYRTLLDALFDEWSAIGFEISVVTSSLESYVARWRDPEGVDLLIARWVPDYDDPDNLTYVMFHSRQGALRRYLALPELDQLVERARHAGDADRRQALYHRLESLFVAEQALLPLFHDIDYRIARPRVRGLRHLSTPPFVSYAEIALGRPAASAPRARLPGASTLRVPVPASFDSLDPALTLYVEPAEVVPNVFETLTSVGEGARIVPHLASALSVEEGGRRFRFQLRRDVRFHDGRRLTARDVRYSFERLLRSPHPGVEAALLPVRGARAYAHREVSELAGFTIHSAQELTLELERPLGFFPAMLTNPMTAIVPEGATELAGSWRQGCAGTGPFRVVRFDPGERIDLEANPHYWRRGLPRCRRLVFELGTATEEIDAGLRDRRFAVAAGLPAAEVEALRQEKRHAAGLVEAPGFSTYFLLLNARRGPFADRRTRRAFRRALDVAPVIAATLGRLAVPAHGLISPGLLGHETAGRRPASDPADGPSLAGLELRTAIHPVYQGQYGRVWGALAAAISALGVELSVAGESMAEILRLLTAGEVDLVAARRIAAYPDADAFVGMLHSKDGLLGPVVGQEDVDRLIEQGREEADPALRHAIYRRLEDVLARHALLIPLFDEQLCCFARPEIEGLRLRLGWPKIAYEELRRAD